MLTEDYPVHHYRMRTWPGSGAGADRANGWLETNGKLRRSILSELRRRGPLRVRDLTDHAVEGCSSSATG